MSIEIFAFPPSPRAFKAIALASHLGLDVTVRPLDFSKGEHKAPDYVALNPNGMMPTLRDGGYVLWEANAIMQRDLAGRKPQSGLLHERRARPARRDALAGFWDLAHWGSGRRDPADRRISSRPVLLGGRRSRRRRRSRKATEMFAPRRRRCSTASSRGASSSPATR